MAGQSFLCPPWPHTHAYILMWWKEGFDWLPPPLRLRVRFTKWGIKKKTNKQEKGVLSPKSVQANANILSGFVKVEVLSASENPSITSLPCVRLLVSCTAFTTSPWILLPDYHFVSISSFGQKVVLPQSGTNSFRNHSNEFWLNLKCCLCC